MANSEFTISPLERRRASSGRSRPRRTGLSSRARPLSVAEVRQWQAALARIYARLSGPW
jgi:hypothetical protein